MSLDAQVVVRRESFTLDVSLSLVDGEVLGVLGPNGAGKTTLLHALAGLVRLSDGHVRLGPLVLDDVSAGVRLPPERRRTGFVFQDYLLFPHLSAVDNVAYGPRVQGIRRSTAREAALSWLDRMDLSTVAGRRPRELSGGQAQRVALARALAVAPRLLLLDEPLAALDAGTRLAVRTDLRRHLTSYGGPAVVVTHDLVEAMVLADRLVVLEHGRIVQTGPPAEVARRPRTAYVADLVGLNLCRGTASPDGRVPFAGGLVGCGLTGDVLLAVRPSAVRLHRGRKPASALGRVPRPSGGADGAPCPFPRFRSGQPTGGVLVAADTTEVAAGSSARPDRRLDRRPHPPTVQGRALAWRGRVVGMEAAGDRVRVSVAGPPDVRADVDPACVAELGLADGTEVWAEVEPAEVEAYPDY